MGKDSLLICEVGYKGIFYTSVISFLSQGTGWTKAGRRSLLS